MLIKIRVRFFILMIVSRYQRVSIFSFPIIGIVLHYELMGIIESIIIERDIQAIPTVYGIINDIN